MQIVYTNLLYHKLKRFATGYFGIIAKNEESVQIVRKLRLKEKMIFASFWYKRKRGVGQHDAAKPSPKARHGRRTTKGRRAEPHHSRRSRVTRRGAPYNAKEALKGFGRNTMLRRRPQKRGMDAAQIRDGGGKQEFSPGLLLLSAVIDILFKKIYFFDRLKFLIEYYKLFSGFFQ